MRWFFVRALKLYFSTIPPPNAMGNDVDSEKARMAVVNVQTVTTIRTIAQIDGS